METRFKPTIRMAFHSCSLVCSVAALLHFGRPAGYAQTYLYSGARTTITLNPGTYIITAYGAQGGQGYYGGAGGLGAEMSAEFSFSGTRTLTLLVGGGGVAGTGNSG